MNLDEQTVLRRPAAEGQGGARAAQPALLFARQPLAALPAARDGADVALDAPVRRADRSRLACVVPMYNEGGHARAFIEALHAVVAPLFAQVRIVAVNDGSRDGTGAEVAQAVAAGLPVHYLGLSRNFGKEAALTAGLEAAAAFEPDVVLIIDGDFQHPLDVVPRMVAHWARGIDMAYGVQTHRERAESWALRRAKRLFYRLMAAATADGRFEIPRDAGDFRLFDRRVLDALNRLPERNRYMKGLYAWVGFSSLAVPFEVQPRRQGLSSFNALRLMELALDGLTAFSHWPLRLAAIVGVTISALALMYGVWIVFEWAFVGQEVEGFTTLAAALMFFSGIQLMSIGLMGEYIGRVFVEVKRRPLYVVGEELGGGAPRGADAGVAAGRRLTGLPAEVPPGRPPGPAEGDR